MCADFNQGKFMVKVIEIITRWNWFRLTTGIGIVWAVFHGVADSFYQENYKNILIRLSPYILYLCSVEVIRLLYHTLDSLEVKLGFTVSGTVIVLFDIALFLQVEYFPLSSTDSISILYLPYMQFLILPIAFLSGVILGRSIRAK